MPFSDLFHRGARSSEFARLQRTRRSQLRRLCPRSFVRGHSRGIRAVDSVIAFFVGFESLNTQDKAKRLSAVSVRLFQDVMATCHPPGIADSSLAKKRRTHCCASTYQEDEAMFGEARSNLVRSFGRNVLAMEARESLNTQGKGECLMAATSHHSKDMMATCHPPGFTGEIVSKSFHA